MLWIFVVLLLYFGSTNNWFKEESFLFDFITSDLARMVFVLSLLHKNDKFQYFISKAILIISTNILDANSKRNGNFIRKKLLWHSRGFFNINLDFLLCSLLTKCFYILHQRMGTFSIATKCVHWITREFLIHFITKYYKVLLFLNHSLNNNNKIIKKSYFVLHFSLACFVCQIEIDMKDSQFISFVEFKFIHFMMMTNIKKNSSF